jgi:hypothetical protein
MSVMRRTAVTQRRRRAWLLHDQRETREPPAINATVEGSAQASPPSCIVPGWREFWRVARAIRKPCRFSGMSCAGQPLQGSYRVGQ